MIWGPFYTLDQIKIENVQRIATRMVVSIKHLSYEQRLQRLGLPTLKYRRQRGDMICVFSLFNNIYDLDYFQFFTMAGSVSTRGHPFKLFKPQLLHDVKSHAFSQRVINDWNKLDSDIVTAPTLSIFKRLYDQCCSDNYCI